MTVKDQNGNHNQQHRIIAPHTKSLKINEEPPPLPRTQTKIKKLRHMMLIIQISGWNGHKNVAGRPVY